MIKGNKRRQSLAKDAETERVCLHEVAKLNATAELGPRHILQVCHDRWRKLSKRLWGIDSDESNGQDYTTGLAEYGHLIEVTNQALSQNPFDIITGPFKNVDNRFLIDQIPLKYPEQKISVRYKSGKTEWLTTVTRLFTEEDSQQSASNSEKSSDILERAKRYKKKKQKKATMSRQQNHVADDDIATLIANTGNDALVVDRTGKMSMSVNKMVSNWQEQETKTKVVVYDSISDSEESLLSKDEIAGDENLDTVLLEREDRLTCWQKFKSCCCASSAQHRRLQSVETPFKVYGGRSLRHDKASERLWLPPNVKIIQMQRTVRAFKMRDTLAST